LPNESKVGETLIEACVAAATVSVAELLVMPDNEAVIIEVPEATPVDTPPETMVAAAVLEDAQVTVEEMLWVVLLL
jgi:hypothetical protein